MKNTNLNQGFSTKAIHLERNTKKQYGAVNNGIFQSSTIVFETYEDFLKADRVYYNKGRLNPQQNTYGRNGTQTVFECERAISSLYNADFCKCNKPFKSKNTKHHK